MAKLYEFTITMCGWGDTSEQAWENCKENFDIAYESIPVKEKIEIIDND